MIINRLKVIVHRNVIEHSLNSEQSLVRNF